MSSSNNRIKKVVILYGGLLGAGGAERLMWNQVEFFKMKDVDVNILAYSYNEESSFNGKYRHPVEVLDKGIHHRFLLRFISKVLVLRRKIYDLKPDVVISQTPWNSPHVYFATLLTPFRYVTQIPGTIFWFNSTFGDYKYAFIHKKVFNEIRESVAGHKEFIPIKMPQMDLVRWARKEYNAILLYLGIRGAQVRFVHTNHMAWEVKKLYGVNSVVLKGAFTKDIFEYKYKSNVKNKLGLDNKKIILNVNRLDPRKRVDLLLRSFAIITDEIPDTFLVIGGKGPDENRLKSLVDELGIKNKVRFVGFIHEEGLWDYYGCCDVFVHPNWCEFCIAPLEALALCGKVVWSTEVELDNIQSKLVGKCIFPADPTPGSLAKAIKVALRSKPAQRKRLLDLLSNYTWDKYSKKVLEVCESKVSCYGRLS